MTFDRQLPGESPPAWQAWLAYRDMGEGRGLQRVVKELKKSLTIIGRWSSRWHWVERAAAYDQHMAAIEQAEKEKLTKASAKVWAARRERQQEEAFQVAEELLARARDMLKFPLAQTKTKDGMTTVHPARWTMDSAARMVETSDKLKRMTLGMATERIEHSGAVAVTAMTPEQIAAFEETLKANLLLESGVEPSKAFGNDYGKGGIDTGSGPSGASAVP